MSDMRSSFKGAAIEPSAETIDEILRNDRFDQKYSFSVSRNVTAFLSKYYFRSRVIGFDPPPQRNNPPVPLIFIGNHSGMAFPWDGIIFGFNYLQKNNHNLFESIRILTAPMLSGSKYMEPYMIDDFWRRIGGVNASIPNFEAMMNYHGSNVFTYPEGVPGVGKGFDKRYQLQRFSTSFLRMALKYKTDIIPVALVNGEYINPHGYKSDALNKLVQKLGIPFLPVGPLTALVPFQPWAFYFGLPAKLTFVEGRRIRIGEFTSVNPEKMPGTREIHRLKNVIQQQLQEDLLEAASQYGQDPYELEELGDLWRDNLDKILYILPSGWPLLFAEHERRFANGNEVQMAYDNGSYFRALIRNPMILAFLLPILGWPALLKWKDVI